MTEFETPLMRDLQKILPSLVIGILIAIGIFTLLFARFHAEYHGNGCIITTAWTIPKYIMQMISGC